MNNLYLSNNIKEKLNTTTNKNLIKEGGFKNTDDYLSSIIKQLNLKNPKLKVNKIIFEDVPISFVGSDAQYTGRIGNEENKILAYAFFSPPEVGSRNVYGAQHIFPGLSKIVDAFIDKEHLFDLSNKPMYFINGTLENITDSMQSSIISMQVMGIRYVDIFKSRLKDLSTSDSLLSFTKLISYKFDNEKNTIYTDLYDYNLTDKSLVFHDKYLGGNINSFGSRDRFYVMKAYAALILADRENINYDVSIIEEFILKKGRGKNNLNPFVQYANKLSGRK